jgi:hypothetical protein
MVLKELRLVGRRMVMCVDVSVGVCVCFGWGKKQAVMLKGRYISREFNVQTRLSFIVMVLAPITPSSIPPLTRAL